MSSFVIVGIGVLALLSFVIIVMVIRFIRLFSSKERQLSDNFIHNPYYDKINDFIFYGEKHRLDTDAQFFDVYDRVHPYAHNDTVVFFKNHIIPSADVATFQVMGKFGVNFYARDKKTAFYNDRALPNSDSNSFSPIAHSEFSKDERSVFYREKVVAGVHAPTFEVLQAKYAKDRSSYYLGRTKISIDQVPHNVINDNLIKI